MIDQTNTARDSEDATLASSAEFGSRPLPEILKQLHAMTLGDVVEAIEESELSVKIAEERRREARYVGTVARDRLREILTEHEGGNRVEFELAAREIDTAPEFIDPDADRRALGAEIIHNRDDWGSAEEGDRPAPVMLDAPISHQEVGQALAEGFASGLARGVEDAKSIEHLLPRVPETRESIQADAAAMARLAQAGRVAEQRQRAAAPKANDARRLVVTELDSGSSAHEVATVARLAHAGDTADEDARQREVRRQSWDR